MKREFLEYEEKVRNLSQLTLKAYEKDLGAFISWAGSQGYRWSTISQADIEQYIMYLHDEGAAPATIRRAISTLRQFFTWAHHRQLLSENPARWLQSPKLKKRLPVAADLRSIWVYLQQPATTWEQQVAHAYAALLSSTGIRLQEAIDIRLEDVNTQDHTIKIHGKGRKERIIYYLSNSTRHWEKLAGQRPGFLLPISDQRTIRTIIWKELHTHPHAMRHAFACLMLRQGAALPVISKILGHESVKTTERYARVIDAEVKQQYYQTIKN